MTGAGDAGAAGGSGSGGAARPSAPSTLDQLLLGLGAGVSALGLARGGGGAAGLGGGASALGASSAPFDEAPSGVPSPDDDGGGDAEDRLPGIPIASSREFQ